MPTLISIKGAPTGGGFGGFPTSEDPIIIGIAQGSPLQVARKIYNFGLIYVYKDIYDPFGRGGYIIIESLRKIENLEFPPTYHQFIHKIIRKIPKSQIFNSVENLLAKSMKYNNLVLIEKKAREAIKKQLEEYLDLDEEPQMSPEKKLEIILNSFQNGNDYVKEQQKIIFEIIAIFLKKAVKAVVQEDLIFFLR